MGLIQGEIPPARVEFSPDGDGDDDDDELILLKNLRTLPYILR